jgi:hypothetical protein
MSRLRPIWVGVIGWLWLGAAAAQNLEAGKSPAQIFADTCTACHRNARELKHPTASFMREHYTTSSDMASAMAGYLASFPVETRAAQPKQPPAAAQGPADASRSRRSPTEQASGADSQALGQPHQPGSAERGTAPETRQASNPRRPTASAEAIKPAPPLEDAKPAAANESAKPPLATFEE